MLSRDANCRAISQALRILQERGADLSSVTKDLPITLEELLQPSTWLDWKTAATVLERIEARFGGRTEYLEFVADVTRVLTDSPFLRIVRVAATLKQLYRLAVRVIMPSIYPIHTATFRRLDGRTLHVTLSLPEEVPGCEVFFWGAYSTFMWLPQSVGLGRAHVKARIHAHFAQYTITLPQSRSHFARVSRGLRNLFSNSALDELDKQQREIETSHHQLQEAYDALRTESEEHGRVREELEHQELQLRQAQKMQAIGNLTGGIAHDFNNHLVVIMGYAELLAQIVDSGAARDYVDRIHQAATASSNLTKQLLAFGRRQLLRPHVININKLVDRLDPLLRRTIGEAVTLKLIQAKGLGQVRVDVGQLEQVLLNLVINARDAVGPTDGTIAVETANVLLDSAYAESHPDAHEGPHVMMSVADNGRGIQSNQLLYIFEPFFTTKETGSGLGLSTVQGIVGQSGGSVDVQSEVGVGTTLKVYLPRVDAPADRWEEIVPIEAATQGSGNILVVEDDILLGDLLEVALSRAGYQVSIARNGEQALKIAANHDPDLILTDIVMPGMTGREMIRKLQRTRPKLRAVYMTGYAENADTRRAELENGAHLIEKPFTTGEILALIKNALS